MCGKRDIEDVAIFNLCRQLVVAYDDRPSTDLLYDGNCLEVVSQGVWPKYANDERTITVLKGLVRECDIGGKLVQIDRLQREFAVDILAAGGRASAGGCT